MTPTQYKDPNKTAAEAGWPPAVIAGAYQTGVLGVRGLHRRGVNVTSFDCNPAYPGFRSVYGKAHLCPNPDTDPDAWVRFMRDLATRIGAKAVLIASSDQFVSAIATHAKVLADYYLLSPGARIQGLLATKETQYELAAGHGMPIPRTQFVHSIDEVSAFASDATFPCLMKPIHFREWQAFPEGHILSYEKVAIADSPSQLIDNWRLAAAVNPSAILQEIIQGMDTDKRVYLSCYDRSGKRIAHALMREYRCDPVGFGPASVTEPVEDPEADRVCDDFLQRIGYAGICEIELKRDTRDGRLKMIEANPRLSGGGDAAPYAGVDLCWLHYLDVIGETVVPVGPSGRIFRHITLRSDVQTIIAYRRARLISWGDVLRSYRPPLAFMDFDLRDPRYSAETILIMASQAARGVFQWLFRRTRRS